MTSMRVLLVTPPMVQFNTAYPAAPMLAAWLRRHGHEPLQEDLSLALALRLFSPAGVREVGRTLRRRFPGRGRPPAVGHFLRHAGRIESAVAGAVAFLRGSAPELVGLMIRAGGLPEGPRFEAVESFPRDSDRDARARWRASLFLDEIADAVRAGVDPRFELARYAERLAADVPSFDPLARALAGRRTLIDRWIDEAADRAWRLHRPHAAGFTVPFPGAFYGACRVARRMKAADPSLPTILGGGYVNTELRELNDPRVFDGFDFIVYDDGEVPLLRILEHVQGRRPLDGLVRTKVRRRGRVVWRHDPGAGGVRHRDRPAPEFPHLARAGYLPMAESPNPMHRLWSERRWIKLPLAHGCYWRRCAFCDTSLDYIRRFDPAEADRVIGWMPRAMDDTGERSFHFVDEAAPPALLQALARRLRERRLDVEWWTNVRFESSFTPALARAMARSGCIAVTGGLECAQDRLLRLMDKGFDLPAATRVARAFASAGLLVHAYLMYGYPTQTVGETVDALEYVRQMFAAGCLHSAYWHRFALTVHSPAFRDSERLGLRLSNPRKDRRLFARNEAAFEETGGADHGRLGCGLRKAVYNFMLGIGLDADVREWFDFPMPAPTLARDFVRRTMRRRSET